MENFGQRLYVTGVGPDTAEVDLRALIYKYTHHEPQIMDRVDLDTPLPAYIVTFEALNDGELQQIATRINGMYWHEHQVIAHVM